MSALESQVSREQLFDTLRRLRPRIHPLETPEGLLYVRSLNGAARAELGNGQATPAKIAAYSLCSPDGALLFNPRDDESVSECDELDGKALDLIVARVFELAGLTKEAIDNAEKKSEPSQNA